MTTTKEMLELAMNDIQQLDLTHYTAMYRINDIANLLINASSQLGKELFEEASNA